MTRHIIGHNRAVFDSLHPATNKAIVGLALWFTLSAWILFSGFGSTSLMFTIVSLFFLITILISIALWLVWRRHHQVSSSAQNPVVSFTDWVSGTFDTWQGRPKGVEAAVQVLLPIAAVAFGLTAIGIVLRIVASGIR
jgi:hypothetical protein